LGWLQHTGSTALLVLVLVPHVLLLLCCWICLHLLELQLLTWTPGLVGATATLVTWLLPLLLLTMLYMLIWLLPVLLLLRLLQML
jgi:hypothetical protein